MYFSGIAEQKLALLVKKGKKWLIYASGEWMVIQRYMTPHFNQNYQLSSWSNMIYMFIISEKA